MRPCNLSPTWHDEVVRWRKRVRRRATTAGAEQCSAAADFAKFRQVRLPTSGAPASRPAAARAKRLLLGSSGVEEWGEKRDHLKSPALALRKIGTTAPQYPVQRVYTRWPRKILHANSSDFDGSSSSGLITVCWKARRPVPDAPAAAPTAVRLPAGRSIPKPGSPLSPARA